MKEQHPNLSAYNDVENLDRFTDERFISYCKTKLDECKAEQQFIADHCIDSAWKGRVCEIGSGNSKLLYNLEQAGVLRYGIGYEISHSRYLFAEKFGKHVNSQVVHNINNDFLKEKPLQDIDLVIGVDIVFQLISPLYAGAEQDALNWIHTALRHNGYLLFELRDFDEYALQLEKAKKDYLHHWEEFPDPDPFEFMLVNIYYDEERHLHWDKTFLERKTANKSTFNNVLKPYSRDQIRRLLESAGFRNVRIFESVAPGLSTDTYWVLAQK
jgi:SAM-dependent methyltransferase